MLPEGLANNHKGYPLYAFGVARKMLCLMWYVHIRETRTREQLVKLRYKDTCKHIREEDMVRIYSIFSCTACCRDLSIFITALISNHRYAYLHYSRAPSTGTLLSDWRVDTHRRVSRRQCWYIQDMVTKHSFFASAADQSSRIRDWWQRWMRIPQLPLSLSPIGLSISTKSVVIPDPFLAPIKRGE
jgi:hypothetical protein